MGRVERRGRKRRRNDVQSVEADQDGKKRMVGTRSKVLVGRYVRKEFEGNGTFLGKIMNYDSGLYRVNYEDGDCEDLDSSELKGVLIDEDMLAGDWLERRKKLDELVISKEVTKTDCHVENAILQTETAPPSSELGSAGTYKVEAGQVDDNAEYMSDLSEDDEVLDLSSNVETPVIPPPELPPSSGNVGVPEEFVSYIFSVYSFLRSFSIRIFLSPFGLDDFVGSLNCPVPNTLLDSVHVALMRVLRRHIEKLSLDGSERASKCSRNLDWSLLDSMTWPIYLLEYLMVMGYINGPVWKGFSAHVLEREYYSLPVGQKLMILQILCDDVLDSEELRAEMDIREESEFGMDSDGNAVTPMSGPRRVHPRYSKTSAFKEQESMEIIAKDHDMRSSNNASTLSSKVSAADAGTGVDHDGNGDECRLCGMEGTLLCCDGCPSSYHGRCIGVCKMYIPDGNWYCPECRINELRPTPIRGTFLKGADLFGVDSHGQIFMGSCDHLLVLKDSTNSDCFRYYNENDISIVLQALNTNVEHHALYSEICKGIREFWGIPAIVLPHTVVTEIGSGVTNRIEGSGCSVPSLSTSLGKESHFSENFATCATEISSENTHFHEYPKELMLNEASDRIVQPDNSNFTVRQASDHMNSVCAGSVSQQVDLSRQTQKDNTVLIETASCIPRNSSVNGVGVVPSERGKFHERTGARSYKNSSEGGLYTGYSFKAQGYVNNYLHGDFAASAAANLAILSSEENQCSESHSLEKRRKLMSVDIQLQTKAFSSAATRFFWPNTDKKLIEVPRERCSWCLSCKAPVVSKKACLLNGAASNATKGAMKILATVRPAKSGDGNLSGIATYVILMEESLRGLTVGPFLSEAFRKSWRKLAEEATSCYTVKSLLLELEENIRTVALSADWVKLIDVCSSESSVSQTASSVTGSTHKRKPGRRGRKPSAVSDVTADVSQDVLTDFTWWRGGMLSKFMFQRGTLPRSMVNKAARQGGRRKIPGIYYSEGCEPPKRSRRLVWRAAVEMCKTVSQLALQVRYLDMHVRWIDLVRPEPSLQEGKGLETEASAFRNAFICDKGMVDNEIRYGVAFGNQKHLSSRVMKSVIEKEQGQDGKEKYWFSELRIPLYLIKEYEAKLVKTLPSAVDNPVNAFSKWSRKSSKTFNGDIFSYLTLKRDGGDTHSCAVCQMDVLLRYGIKCSVCEGLCHEQCTTSSMFKINEEVQGIISCKNCHQNSSVTRCGINNESPTSPLLLQGQDFANVDTACKGGMLGSSNNRLSASTGGGNVRSSGAKQTSSANSKAKTKSWGVIWNKPSATDTGVDFRKKNVLRKGDPINGFGPNCQLCRKTYNSNLMYIHCEMCKHWYHADALEIDESNISNVAGFKCCRCRRIKIPICPYLDPDSKKQLKEKRIRARTSKVDDLGMESDSGIIPEKYQEEEPSTPMVQLKDEIASLVDDDFLCSLPSMEKSTKQNPEAYCENTASLSGRGPKKLPIRRHVKQENFPDSSFANNPPNDYSSTPFGENTREVITPCVDWGAKLPVRRPMKSEEPDYSFADPQVELSTHLGVEWNNTSTNGCEDVPVLNCDGLSFEDMEFEPQTYFSFNELLESDDCAPFDGGYGNVPEKWENASEFFPHDEMANIPNTGNDPLISIESAGPTVVPCMMCSHTDPSPTLCCQICGIQIHGHCSPWVEQPSTDSVWRCGNCREWR